MSDLAIKVENLSKEYRLGVIGQDTLHKAITSKWARMRGKEDPNSKIGDKLFDSNERFLALNDVSFEVKKGEVLGVIGGNGAGKSTLLKILSQITSPTQGKISINGRLASLLEVGTGFHPELTGRENVYMNGAILGMKKSEIDRKYDEIVEFAEIEKFIDTPVKRYSSGMYVRLAFAVAAHLEPDILIVDEVLAVGDAKFQKKCLGKMGDVSKKDGRTVLFVSHNMGAVMELCNRCLLLEKGNLKDIGNTNKVIQDYLKGNMTISTGTFKLTDVKLRTVQSSDGFRFYKACIYNSKNENTPVIGLQEPFTIELYGTSTKKIDDMNLAIGFTTQLGQYMFNSFSNDIRNNISTKYEEGDVKVRIHFNKNYFAPGIYAVDVAAIFDGSGDYLMNAFSFSITDTSSDYQTILRSTYNGVIIPPCLWERTDLESEE